jgi:integrase
MVGGGTRRRERSYSSLVEARRLKGEQQREAYEARLRRERWSVDGAGSGEEINGRSTVYDYYRRWLKHGRDKWSPATIDGRVAHYQRLLHDTFGARRLCDITPHLLEDWFRGQLESGRPYRSVEYAFGCMRALLRVAVTKRHLEWNPALAVDLPEAPPRPDRRDHLHASEYRSLVAACSDDMQQLFVRLGGEAALRRGEICALRVDKLDLDARELHVARTVVKPQGKAQIEKLPKSGKPRYVALTTGLRDLLAAHIDAYGLGGDDLLFTASDGSLAFNPNTCRAKVQAAMVTAGLVDESGKSAFTLHDLRRSAATFARERGASFEVIQDQLGHGRRTVTAQHYLRNRCNPALHEFAAALEGILEEAGCGDSAR